MCAHMFCFFTERGNIVVFQRVTESRWRERNCRQAQEMASGACGAPIGAWSSVHPCVVHWGRPHRAGGWRPDQHRGTLTYTPGCYLEPYKRKFDFFFTNSVLPKNIKHLILIIQRPFKQKNMYYKHLKGCASEALQFFSVADKHLSKQ